MRLLFFFVLAYCCRADAQDSTILVKAGTSINESVPLADLYQYSEFVFGKVFFRSGDSGAARMNYHKILDEMQFIDPKGDTLNIANPGMIKLIRINVDSFYYDEGYVKHLKEVNGFKLAIKQTLRLAGKEKIGAYNLPSGTSAIDSYGTLIDHKGMHNLVPREDITLARKTQYYIGDRFNHFVWVTRKNIQQQFSKQSKAISKYFKETSVDLNNREDLEKLLQFLASL